MILAFDRGGLLVVAFLTILGVAACSERVSTTAPSPASDSITLLNITPAEGTILLRGQTVTFSGTVSYRLVSADSGVVALVIQDESDRGLQGGAQPSAIIRSGTGQTTLSQTITLLSIGINRVRLFFLLDPTGLTRTEVVRGVLYEVR